MATRPLSRPPGLTALTRQQLLPFRTCRSFSSTPPTLAMRVNKAKQAAEKKKKKQKRDPYYKVYNMKEMQQYSLCDAMRYIKAFEIGQASPNSKYEVHVRLKTRRSGPVIRPNQLKLPHTVKTDVRFAVICPPDSKAAQGAKDAGAVLVGEENVFEAIKTGNMNFERLIAHPTSMQKLQREGLPRILGPKGLMPNPKNGTISTDPKALLTSLMGGALFKERAGVLSMAIGKIHFTPEMLRDNLRAFLARIKLELRKLPEENTKEIHEVVLSSTKSPGFSLNGMFRTETSPATSVLAAG